MRRLLLLSSGIAALAMLPVAAPSIAQEDVRPFGRRIVGGEKTDIKHHPWQVAVDVKINGKPYLCGGSIVADRWVLTAAHCFTGSTKPGEVRAKAGSTNYVTGGVWSEVERIVIHENYNSRTHENDLALVLLRGQPDGQVIPLLLAERKLSPGQPLEVTGWGATSEGGQAARTLMKARVPYVENDTCNAPSAYNGAIKPGMMCAGYREGGIDSCQGDSGGPLVWRTAEGPLLVGVVSWGEGCARKLKYGVYTRVATQADWIQSVIAGNAQ